VSYRPGGAMLVRDADRADVDGLASCIVTSWLQAHRHQVPHDLWERRREDWTVDVSAAAWDRTLAEIAASARVRSHVLVATDSATVVGLVMGTVGDHRDGEVNALYVLPEHQGRGVGRQLLLASFDRLWATGARSVSIVVLAANAPARRFYERMGGSEAGPAEVEEDDDFLPAVAYTWPLNASPALPGERDTR